MRASQAQLPAVSVLIPCYNAASTLPKAVDSLLRQTMQDFEIVAVDDGSSDDTSELLQSYSRADPRIKVITQAHGGVTAALNAGLSACSAPYIARMDADDYSFPQRLEKQVDYLDTHPEAAVIGCLVEGISDPQLRQGYRIYIDWLNSLVSDAEIRREIFVESPFAHPSVTVRGDWLKRLGGYQEHGWAEDYDLWLRFYQDGACFAKLPEVLFGWRDHPQRLTRTDERYSLENFIRLKAHYLARRPLAGCDAVIIWGAGMIGRSMSKYLLRKGIPLVAFVDIDPAKIGRTRRGLPILPPEALPDWWRRYDKPAALAAVGVRGARQLIRNRLNALGLTEGSDWWGVA